MGGFSAMLVLVGATLVTLAAAPVADAVPPTAGTVVPLTPARILDSRSGIGVSAGAIAPHATVSLQVAGRGGVPATGVSSVTLNVTVTAPTHAGYVSVWASGGAVPSTSNVNFAPAQTLANLVVTSVGADGKINLLNGSDGTVQLIADVSGYVNAGAATTSGTLTSVAPARVLDTRSGVGASTGAIAPRSARSVAVGGLAGLPISGVAAVLVNVTVTQPSAAGYVSASPDTNATTTSNVNFAAGQTVANLVVAPVGTDGKINLVNGSDGTIHLIADVFGYILGGTTAVPGALTGFSPSRILDTRIGRGAPTGAIAANGSVAVQIDGTNGLPASGVAAVILNITATAPTAAGFITAWDGVTQPGTSNLNFLPNQTVPNLVVAPVGINGKVSLYNGSSGTVQLVADVAGYVLGVPDTTAPAAVTSLTTSVTETTATLNWTNPSDPDLAGITIRRSVGAVAPSSPTNGTMVAEVQPGTSTFTDSGLTSGSQYTYALFAHDYVPNYASTTTTAVRTLSWHSAVRAAAVPHGAPTDVSCSSPTFCLAVDSVGSVQSYNGTTWTAWKSIDPSATLTKVSCSSSSFCMAIDDHSRTVRYTGTGWDAPVDLGLSGSDTLTSISCVSSTFCLLADNSLSVDGQVLRFDGTTWQSVPIAAPRMQGIESVSCVSSTFCAALSYQGWAATFNGTTWSSAQNAGSADSGHISCASPTSCVAASGNGTGVGTFDGTTWTVQHPASSSTKGLSCPSPTFCVRVDDSGNAQTFNGTTWSGLTVVDARGLTAVSCGSASACVAVAYQGESYAFNGSTWTGPTVFDAPGGGLEAISCPAVGHCKAADGYSGVVAFDGSWGATAVIDSAAAPSRVGFAPTLPELSLSCPTLAFCELSDSAGHYSTFNGTNWAAPATIAPAGLSSCPSPTFCLQVGGTGSAASTYNGSAWSSAAPAEPYPFPALLGVSCASATSCVAADQVGSSVSYDGIGWGTPQPMGLRGVTTISCPVTGFCVAGGVIGDVAVYHSGTWGPPVALDAGDNSGLGIRSVSCASANWCVAISSHSAYVFNGVAWGSAEAIDPAGSGLTAISCASANYCTAVDYNGLSYTLS